MYTDEDARRDACGRANRTASSTRAAIHVMTRPCGRPRLSGGLSGRDMYVVTVGGVSAGEFCAGCAAGVAHHTQNARAALDDTRDYIAKGMVDSASASARRARMAADKAARLHMLPPEANGPTVLNAYRYALEAEHAALQPRQPRAPRTAQRVPGPSCRP